MKKIIIILIFVLSIFNANVIYGSEPEEIIEEQEETLGISGFIKQAEEYTSDVFEDIDINEVYKSAISGNTNVKGIVREYIKTSWERGYKNYHKSWVHINYHSDT